MRGVVSRSPSHFQAKILGNFNWRSYSSPLKLILKFFPHGNLKPKAISLSEISGSIVQIQWSSKIRTSTAMCFTATASAARGLCSKSLLGCDGPSSSSWCKFSCQNKYSQASRNRSVAQSKFEHFDTSDTLQFCSVFGFPSHYYAKFSRVPISQGYLHLLPKANTSKTQQPYELALLNQNALTNPQPCS